MNKLGWFFSCVVLVLLASGGFLWHSLQQFTAAKINVDNAYLLNVEQGESVRQVVNKLPIEAGVNNLGFRVWLKLNPEKAQIKKGLYDISPHASVTDIIDLLIAGKVKQFSVTLIEGHTFKQWLTHLSSIDTLTQDLPNDDALYAYFVNNENSICANEYQHLEGCFLPDTYFYTYKASASSILQRAFDALEHALEKAWQQRFLDLPINSPYEALILASIIEKETAIDSERSKIAGVFVNRLESNMRLQTDPTVIYGVGDAYNGDITRKHLRTPTPYNTYVIKGLPITPIAMASMKSIIAAVNPAITDAFYFVATGDGGHRFSVTLQAHNQAVRDYLMKQKQQQNEGTP